MKPNELRNKINERNWELLLDAINEGNYQISIHGQLIYNYLRESYTKDRCDYQEVCPNHFFLTFYSLCESVMKYGDKKTKEGSLFIKNLSYLKEDINIYITTFNDYINETNFVNCSTTNCYIDG